MTRIEQRAFERACILILGTKAKWSKEELEIRNRVTRQLFGRKRTKPKTIRLDYKPKRKSAYDQHCEDGPKP